METFRQRTYLPLAADDELLQTVGRQFDGFHGAVGLRQPLVLQTLVGRHSLSESKEKFDSQPNLFRNKRSKSRRKTQQ